jgi:hypothetical protein
MFHPVLFHSKGLNPMSSPSTCESARPKAGWLAVGFGLLLCGGCAHPSPSLFPLGIYGIQNKNDLAIVRSAGFNLVTGPARADFLAAAQTLGLKVLASPDTSAGTNFNATAARRAVTTFDAHPALWAWYLVDEPDLALVSPEDVTRAHRFLKSIPAHKPTALVLFNAPNALYYAHLSDIMMIDRYPIPWLPLANFGQHVRQTRLALGQKKPLIAVIQAFDWRYYPELLPGEENLRPPNSVELRCMTYLALALRANGLFYYAFNDGRWNMIEHPDTWRSLTNLIGEVNERLPLFQAEHRWWPYRHYFYDWPHRFNAAMESSITPAWLRVTSANAAVPAGDYLLLVNNTGQAHTYRISLPYGISNPIPVLGENRKVQPVNRWLEDNFAPLAVHIYGPLPSAPATVPR